MMRAVVLLSGRGSNMEALLRADLPVEFAAVISNQPDAEGLAVATSLGVAIAVVDHRQHDGREAFDTALAAEIDRHAPDLVILAGFMRVLTADFVRHYQGRMINIHPALLPAFPGLHTHARALAAGVRVHGCTVHFVTPEVDVGPIIVQAAVPVFQDDDEASLSARVLEQEHRIFPLAVRWYAEGRLDLRKDATVRVEGVAASASALISPPPDAG
ncbi:MAG: phosphoribosylglycinamide formyltransferase [Gallionellaceae bacterium]|nr:phosphoribosylglycinamide formyltransferase [Gallionellaceae bacterium]